MPMCSSTVLIATLQYLTEKDAALTVLDTHAGAGLYRLDGDYASTSAEASDGILRLVAPKCRPHPALAAYVDMVRAFNQGSKTRVYPGSPFISQRLLRGHDKLKLFELHPRTCVRWPVTWPAGSRRQVAVLHEDGFEGIKNFCLHRPAALWCCAIPAMKSRATTARCWTWSRIRSSASPPAPTRVWYPIIPRPEAHDLPRRLKTLATKAGKELAACHVDGEIQQGHGKRGWETKRPGCQPAACFNQSALHPQARTEGSPAPNGGVAGARQARHLHTGIGQLRKCLQRPSLVALAAGVLASTEGNTSTGLSPKPCSPRQWQRPAQVYHPVGGVRPRSLMRTTTPRPSDLAAHAHHGPERQVRWAAVMACISKRSPLAVRRL